MRRLLLIAGVIAASAAFVAFLPVGNSDDGYLVRGYFDSGAFMVEGQDVRIAGANAGLVESVEVALPGETVSLEDGGRSIPGKAVVVMRIEDPGFQDFRADASCVIRPQSLIGERYVDCEPTKPRSSASAAPPPLEEIPEGERGEGQRMLPLESNGQTVDIDFVQNIQREPFADRFRLVLNELGTTLAGRGEDIAAIVERANPALREANRVLATLSSQRRRLAQLASDSREILEPLARERRRLTGFIDGAGIAAEATAERRPALEESLAKLPGFLVELRETMVELEGFSEAGLPMARDFRVAAPSFARATEALEPFSEGATVALESFGDAAEEAGPDIAALRPIVTKTRDLAVSGRPTTRNLSLFLRSLRGPDASEGGFAHLMDLIYNLGASVNGYDEFGHYMRTVVAPDASCDRYSIALPHEGCEYGWAATEAGRFSAALGNGSAPEPQSANGGAANGGADASGAADANGDGPASGSRRAARDLVGFLVGEEDEER